VLGDLTTKRSRDATIINGATLREHGERISLGKHR